MTQIVSIKDTRSNLAEIIDQVAIGEDTFVITKFGKPRAMIVPFSEKKTQKAILEESFGVWKNRKDIKDSGEWARSLRVKMNTRNE